MNVNPTAVTNAANLSLFMVNLSQVLMCDVRQTDPDFGVLDLKSYYRGYRYATEMLKILPIILVQLLQCRRFGQHFMWLKFGLRLFKLAKGVDKAK